MKLYRNAVILLVVLGLLIGAYAVVKNKKASDGQTDDTDTIKIFDLDTDKMVEMTIENEEGTFVFVRETVKEKEGDEEVEKKVWKVSSPGDFKMDESTVKGIAINFSSVTADKLVEENAADLAKYGLDKPVVVTVKMEDGTVKALEVGDETPTKSGYYAKEKGSSKVYTIDSYTGRKLKASKNDLRDKRLFGIETEDVKGLVMERKGQLVFSSKKAENSDWEIISPIKGKVNLDALYLMLNAVSQTNVDEFVEENASDLSQYGLTSPAYAIEVETSSGKKKLLFGTEKEKGSSIYAKFADSDEVFTLPLSSFSFLDKPLKEIVDAFAYIVAIDDVEKIVVEMDGQRITSEIYTDKDDRDKDRFLVNGKDVTGLKDDNGDQLFRKYYQALIGVTLADIEPDASPSGPADIIFTYYLKKEPGTMKVEFIPKDDRYYYVKRNGEYTGILVEKKAFDKSEGVRDTYKKLAEAMSKQE